LSGIPVHLHHRTEEGFYVVDGELALRLDGDALIRGPGSYVLVRAGRPHTFRNPSDRPATYLTVMSPAGFEKYLVDLANGLRRVATGEGRGRSPRAPERGVRHRGRGTTAARGLTLGRGRFRVRRWRWREPRR
jgi:hypothetical protein